MKYDFPEAKLGKNFAKDNLSNVKELIKAGLSFVLVSMPGVGVSCFLKYLAGLDFAEFTAKQQTCFIHVDLYSLPALTQHEFYKLLLLELGGKPTLRGASGTKTDEQLLIESKKKLGDLSKTGKEIIIIFSRFDQLKDQFDSKFLSSIQNLTSAGSKILLIFTATKPFADIAPEALTGGNLNFYSENLYFKPYTKEDLRDLFRVDSSKPVSKELLEKLIDLSGGHNQLLHILLSSQKQQNLLLDQFVKMQLKELIDYLDYHQRKTIQKIALGKKIQEVDEYLLGVGLVKKNSSGFELFTPLLRDYIRTNMPVRLPVKEAKLFKLLRQHLGNTVSKDEIFTEVWGANTEDATDWALDALIYRLRKHPFMISNGYIIESQKKVGYSLIAS